MTAPSWGPPERVPFIGIPMKTATETLGIPGPPPGPPGPLSRPTHEALGGLLTDAGFSAVEVEEAEATFEWESPEDFTTFIKEIAPPITAMIDPQPEAVQAEAWAAITDAIRQQAGDDGAVKFSNLVLMAVGRA
jgi:enediyne biosynthesis protein CalE5